MDDGAWNDASFEASWRRAGLFERIDVRSLKPPEGLARWVEMAAGGDDDAPWVGLGVAALRATGATSVVCVGGGNCCREEQLRARPESEWVVVAVERGGGDGDKRPRQGPAIARPEGSGSALVFRVQGGGRA